MNKKNLFNYEVPYDVVTYNVCILIQGNYLLLNSFFNTKIMMV